MAMLSSVRADRLIVSNRKTFHSTKTFPALLLLSVFHLRLLAVDGLRVTRPRRRSHCSTLRSWACQAEVKAFDNNQVISNDKFVAKNLEEDNELISTRAWLEHLPNGAYTVVRCDISPRMKRSVDGLNSQRAWRIFGQPFHIERLKSSYKTFAKAKQLLVIEAELDTAEKVSKLLLHFLLREAETEFSHVQVNDVQNDKQREIYTIMVTLLWHNSSEVVEKICVKGHACSVGKSVDPSATYPQAVKAAIATRSYLPHESSFLDSQNDDILPSRQPAPEAKLSSWCTERRSLEMEFLKRGDSCVNDIILCQTNTGSSGLPSLKLLEGLTSNLFVRLEGGVLMTADVERDGVLGGYARDMVIQQAQKMDLTVRLTAPVLEESHFWKEVFLTSSIKLIVPVDQVNVPSIDEDGSACFRTVWSLSQEQRNNSDQEPALWLQLYQSLLF